MVSGHDRNVLRCGRFLSRAKGLASTGPAPMGSTSVWVGLDSLRTLGVSMLGLQRIAFDAGKFEQLQIFDHFVRGKKTGVPQESFSLSELLTCTESGFFSFRKRISDFVYITFHHLPEHDSLPKTSPYSTFQKMNWPSDYHEYISKGWHIVYQKTNNKDSPSIAFSSFFISS